MCVCVLFFLVRLVIRIHQRPHLIEDVSEWYIGGVLMEQTVNEVYTPCLGEQLYQGD